MTDLVNRALARANGAFIHNVRVLAAYYRAALAADTTGWPEARIAARAADIAKYERLLEFFADTGRFPQA